MAYLDVSEPMTVAIQPSVARAEPLRERRDFSRYEWQIVALAQGDGLASLREPNRLTRILAFLFGGDINRRLSDARLEALRRLSVFAWHYGYAVPVSAIKSFKAAGFSDGQFDALMSAISSERSRFRAHRQRIPA